METKLIIKATKELNKIASKMEKKYNEAEKYSRLFKKANEELKQLTKLFDELQAALANKDIQKIEQILNKNKKDKGDNFFEKEAEQANKKNK